MSFMAVGWKPRSANTVRAVSSSCRRRRAAGRRGVGVPSSEAPLHVVALGGPHGVVEHDGRRQDDRADHQGEHDDRHQAVGVADDRGRRRTATMARSEQAVAQPEAEARPAGRCGPGARVRGRSREPACPIQQRAQRFGLGLEGQVGRRPRPGCGPARRGPGRPARQPAGPGRRRGTTGTRAPAARRPPGSGRRRPADRGARPRPAGCRSPPTSTGTGRRRRRRRGRPGRARPGGSPGSRAPGQQALEGRPVALLGPPGSQ